MQAYFSSAYLAPVEYYAKMVYYNKVCVEQYDNYVKQTYRNRCVIAGPGGRQALTIPTEKSESPKCPMRDIRISDHGHWRHLHWTALESSYNTTPYFEYYRDDFAPFYEKKFEFLIDFNEELTNLVCSLLDIQPETSRTAEYKSQFAVDEVDLRDAIHPKHGDYTIGTNFTAVPYYQVFSDKWGFLPNLSIVDLLFNMGPESVIVLRKSVGLPC